MNVTDNTDYPFLCGFENVDETTDEVECDLVKGTIPSWLNGILYRMGPGVFDIDVIGGKKFSFTHWFDCLSLIHRFEIRKGGRVFYRSRFLSPKQKETIETGGEIGLTFGQKLDPCISIFGQFISLFKTLTFQTPPPNINVTVSLDFPSLNIPNAVVKTDGNFLLEINPETLEPTNKKLFDYNSIVSSINKYGVSVLSAAHEEYDPVTNTYFNFVTCSSVRNTYQIFAIEKDGSSRVAEVILPKDRSFSYIHSFSSTSKYLVLMAWPLFIDATTMLWKKSLTSAMQWKSDQQVHFYVIDRSSMKHVATYESSTPFFCFHTINSYDTDSGDIVIDLVHYKDYDHLYKFELNRLRNWKESNLNMETKFASFKLENISNSIENGINSFTSVPEPTFIDCPIELPRINENFRHNSSYRFVYAVCKENSAGKHHFDSIVKIDRSSKKIVRYKPGKGFTPSEPIFVPNPTYSGEDDGLVLTILLDGNTKKSFLVLLNAKDLTVLAKIEAPKVIPNGFHGSFLQVGG